MKIPRKMPRVEEDDDAPAEVMQYLHALFHFATKLFHLCISMQFFTRETARGINGDFCPCSSARAS